MKSRILTAAKLRAINAHRDHLELFVRSFGKSVEITEALCVKHANVFKFGWPVRDLLSKEAEAVYRSSIIEARAAYASAFDQAKAVRVNAVAEARPLYYDPVAALTVSYERACRKAWADYNTATEEAQTIYDTVCAAAWARAYINDKEFTNLAAQDETN